MYKESIPTWKKGTACNDQLIYPGRDEYEISYILNSMQVSHSNMD